MSMSGIRLDDYLRLTGSDRKTMREEMRPNALRRVKAQLVVEAIIKAEDRGRRRSVDAEIREIAERRQEEFDKIKSGMDERDIEYIAARFLWKKAINLLKITPSGQSKETTRNDRQSSGNRGDRIVWIRRGGIRHESGSIVIEQTNRGSVPMISTPGSSTTASSCWAARSMITWPT